MLKITRWPSRLVAVVSFTIKNIDAREKLKREIEPLLNRNRNKVAVEKNQ